MNPYDGEGDPEEHAEYYNNLMIVYKANDASMCWNFPSTLVKKAIRWHNKLPPRSIYSFKVPCKKFQEDLRNIKHGVNESLKDYSNRFYQEVLLLDDVNQEVVKNLLISACMSLPSINTSKESRS
jgi:hypothetical protein